MITQYFTQPSGNSSSVGPPPLFREKVSARPRPIWRCVATLDPIDYATRQAWSSSLRRTGEDQQRSTWVSDDGQLRLVKQGDAQTAVPW